MKLDRRQRLNVVDKVHNFLSYVNPLGGGAAISKKRHVITVKTDLVFENEGHHNKQGDGRSVVLVESVEVSLVAAPRRRRSLQTVPSPQTSSSSSSSNHRRTSQRKWDRTPRSESHVGKAEQGQKGRSSSTPCTISFDEGSAFSEYLDGRASPFPNAYSNDSINQSSCSSYSSATSSFENAENNDDPSLYCSSHDISSSGSSSDDTSKRPPPPTFIFPPDHCVDKNDSGDERSCSGTVVSSFRPFAGSSTEQVSDEDDLVPVGDDFDDCIEVQNTKRCFGAKRLYERHPNRDITGFMRWRQIPGKSFLIRSANFSHGRRKKQPSVGELYECQRVDFIETPMRLPKMSSRVELPELGEGEYSSSRKRWHAPDIFVVTLSIPLETKGNTEKKNCLTLSFYFIMKPETREILKRITDPDWKDGDKTTDGSEKVNTVRLFEEWCKKSPNDPSMQGRFKFIPFVENSQKKELGIPGWIARWNGTPVMIKRSGKSGFLYEGKKDSLVSPTDEDSVMEMEISFHAFPWLAKHAIEYLRERVFSKVLFNIGFLIEGRKEPDHPDSLIGLAQLGYPRADLAVPSKDFFR